MLGDIDVHPDGPWPFAERGAQDTAVGSVWDAYGLEDIGRAPQVDAALL